MSTSGVRLGPFRLQTPVGRGGMGEIWSALHDAGHLRVAIKLLTDETARSSAWRTTFRNEARAAASLDHRHIVRIFDFGDVDARAVEASGGRLEEGTPWLAMELVEGGTLTALCGHLRWSRVKEVLLGLLDALAHAHARGVLHRDIKPGNVLLGGDPGAHIVVKLTDFGLAHPIEGDVPTGGAVGVDGGTPSYMAPEQFRGQWRDYGPWTDLYALGALTWFLVTGAPPYGRELSFDSRREAVLYRPLPPVVPAVAVPVGFEDWLRTLLQKEPAQRYQRAADAAWGLLDLQDPLLDDDLALPEPRWEMDTLSVANLAQMTTLIRNAVASPPSMDSVARDEPTRVPPHPSDWRSLRRADRRPTLTGAGLGLFGLRPVPVVGRDELRDDLWRELAMVREHRSVRVVALSGPTGFGKSRLAEWLCERAHEVGAATVLRAVHRALPGQGQGLAPMVSRFLRLGGLDEDDTRARVRAVLRSRDVVDDREVNLLSQWLVHGLSALGARPGDARYAFLSRFLTLLARGRPVLVWLDDVQWGLEALRFAREYLGGDGAVLVVLTATTERLAERPIESSVYDTLRRSGMRELQVGPLPISHRPELVREILGLEPELARRVESRTAGNPLFAVQLVGEWVQRGQLVEGEHGFRLREGTDVELPDSVHAVWVDRIERLLDGRPHGDALALELAAVLGQDVVVTEWREACARAGVRASEELEDLLVSERLARSWSDGARRGWSFVHPMLRESVERRAAAAHRVATHHRVCAELLRERGVADPERIGRHLLASGQILEALGPLLEGIDECIASGRYSRAEELLAARERALTEVGLDPADPRWGEGWLRGYRVSRWRSRYQEARSRLQRLEDAARRHGWAALVVHAVAASGRLAYISGNLAEALAKLEDAEALAVSLGGTVLAEVLWDKGEVLSEFGRLADARAVLERSLRQWSAAGDRLGIARCWASLGGIASNEGKRDEAVGLLEWSRDMFRACGSRWGEASALNSLGDLARFVADHQRAEVLYRQSAEIFRLAGSGAAVYPEFNLGLALLELGRYDEAHGVFTSTLTRFEDQGARGSQAVAHMGLAAVAAARGDEADFEQHVRRGVDLHEQTGGADEESARLAERVADLATGMSARLRRSAYQVALEHWRALGRTAESEALELRIRVLV